MGGEPQPVQGSHVHPTPPSWESLCVIKGHSLWCWGAYAKDVKTEGSDWESDQDESPSASFTDASGPQMLHDGLFLLHRASLQTSLYTPRPPHYRVFFCICPLFNVIQSLLMNFKTNLFYYVKRKNKCEQWRITRVTCQSDMEIADNKNKYWTVKLYWNDLIN